MKSNVCQTTIESAREITPNVVIPKVYDFTTIELY